MDLFSKVFGIGTKKRSPRGFTLMEIIIVVITLGVIASLALSSYNKVVEQNYCRSAQMNLIAIHNAVQIYYLKNQTYNTRSGFDLTAINTDLNLSIVDSQFTYTVSADPNYFKSVRATRNSATAYTCSVDSTLALSGNNVNPTCDNATFCSSVLP